MKQSVIQTLIHASQMEIKRKKMRNMGKTALWVLAFPLVKKKMSGQPIKEVDEVVQRIVAALMKNKATEYNFPVELSQDFIHEDLTYPTGSIMFVKGSTDLHTFNFIDRNRYACVCLPDDQIVNISIDYFDHFQILGE